VYWLKPHRSRSRTLRLKTSIARESFHDATEILAQASGQMARNLDPIFEAEGIPEFARPSIHVLLHTLGVGLGVLHDVGIPVANIDHVAEARGFAEDLRWVGT